MDVIALGLIVVPTAGVPVSLASASSKIPPSGQVFKIEIWPNPAAVGRVFVKATTGGAILAALPPAATGAVYPWSSPEASDNSFTPSLFSLDAVTNGDGAFVSLWIK